jgi:Cu(I)/Ag(I) efflux system periplasmic protein CusF
MKRFALMSLVAASLAFPAVADDGHHMADGEVRKVDRDAQKITIRHGPLPQLDMPQPMTMVYRAKEPALLDKAKPGDKVKFAAEKVGGVFTVTRIEPAR